MEIEAIQAGAQDFIVKPFNPGKFWKQLEKHYIHNFIFKSCSSNKQGAT